MFANFVSQFRLQNLMFKFCGFWHGYGSPTTFMLMASPKNCTNYANVVIVICYRYYCCYGPHKLTWLGGAGVGGVCASLVPHLQTQRFTPADILSAPGYRASCPPTLRSSVLSPPGIKKQGQKHNIPRLQPNHSVSPWCTFRNQFEFAKIIFLLHAADEIAID